MFYAEAPDTRFCTANTPRKRPGLCFAAKVSFYLTIIIEKEIEVRSSKRC
jgi:hypothetical protein